MADSFNPKFADLVRNYSDTVGTGNLVLGDVVPGFTSFASALQPGDRFYYSVVGIEKLTEAEVGRGTLIAGGSIAREPVSGVPTNFTSGRKSVALVAASEWFSSVDQVRSAPVSAPDRASLAAVPAAHAALLTEAGRDGLFLFNPANLSAQVAADPAQGIYVAPQSDTTGASGAWVRNLQGPINPEWFGVVAGDVAGANAPSNDAAIVAMSRTLGAMAANTTWGLYQGLINVEFGPGTYEFAAPIELSNGSVTIAGRGMGHGANDAVAGTTRLKFYASTGFLIQAVNTSGTLTADPTPHLNGMASIIRDLSIEGNFWETTGTPEAEHHGIHARAQFHCQNVNIRNFAGDAWHIEADSNSAGGNASSYTMINCHAWTSRNGLFEDGNNTSASTIVGGSFNQNRQWGIWESNFLGNSFVGAEIASNGSTAYNDGVALGASVVTVNGNRYCAIIGQEAWCSANAPSGTASDNQGWAYMNPGAVMAGKPAWFAGMLVRSGGCIRDDNLNSRNSYTGCYAEQDQGKAQISQRSVVSGGMLAVWCYQNTAVQQGTSVIAGGNDGAITTYTGFEALSGAVTARLGQTRGNAANAILYGNHASVSPNGHSLMFSASLNALLLTYGGSTVQSTYQLLVSGPNTTDQFGTGIAQPHTSYMPRLAVGDTSFSRANARRLWVDTAAPVSGEHGQGEFVFYRGAEPNLIGFHCLAAGIPGTWQSLYGLTQLTAAGSGLIASTTDVVLGRASAGGGALEEIACTPAGRALIAAVGADAQRAAIGVVRAVAFHCAGIPAANEVIGGMIAPYDFTISAQNSACKSLAAASAATKIAIFNNGAQIGSFDFAASSTIATATITAPSVATGDQITFHAPATPDPTLADIDGLVRQ